MTQLTVLPRLLALVEATLKLPADRVDVDENLERLGINSLIMMELIEAIDREFRTSLTPALLADVSTLSELAALIDGQVAQPAPLAAATPDATVATASTSPDLLDLVRRRYAVELSGPGLGSLDEVADALVARHADELLRHYGLLGSAPPAPPLHEIAIIGIACRLPDAPDANAFWDNLVAGRNSVREIPPSRWDWRTHFSERAEPGKTVAKWGALVDGVDRFDAGFFGIPAAEAACMDPQQRLLLEEAYHAVEDAGIDMRRLAGSDTGVFIGCQYSEYEQALRGLGNQDLRQGPLFSSSSPSYYLANRISHAFDLRGPSEVVNVNCASSAVAIHRACLSLAQGECGIAIAGGVSLNLFAGDYVASTQYGLLSPNGSSAVFDNDANGFTRGEGVALLVLKPLADAQRDGDRIDAVIKACHQNHRGAARNLSEVRHEAITSVLARCHEKAGIDPRSVRYIEVDGFATKWADSFEFEGVKNALAASPQDGKRCALGSVKGNIGNVEAASAAAHVVKLVLAMRHQQFPATISMKTINSFIDIDSPTHPLYVADRPIAFADLRDGDEPIRAGINSFADSGTNVHLLLEEYLPQPRPGRPAAAQARLFVLSARDGERLQALVARHLDRLDDAAPASAEALADLACTLQTGRAAHAERLAIEASTAAELIDKLRRVHEAMPGDLGHLAAQGIHRGSAGAAAKNPLAGLITAEMARLQLMQSARDHQWRPVALMWVNGVDVPWPLAWTDSGAVPASLPGYPFAPERHWIDFAASSASAVPPARVARPAQAAAEPVAAPWSIHAAAEGEAQAEPMSGLRKLTIFLQQEAAALLGHAVDERMLALGLLDLGLDSTGIAGLIDRVDSLLGIHLSPNTVFQHPSLQALAAHLATAHASKSEALVATRHMPASTAAPAADAGAAQELPTAARAPQDILVAIQPGGEQTPLFALPGAGGAALSLQLLSHTLGPAQPFFCLEPVGLDGVSAPLESVERMARFNVDRLKAQQPAGPYRLLGYSNGGVVAHEMARLLMEGGDLVASLVLLDTLCPPLREGRPVDEMTVAVFNHFARSLGVAADLDVAALLAIPERERSGYLHDFLAARGAAPPRQRFLATFEVATASERACRAHRPGRLPAGIDVQVFKAVDGFAGTPADLGWGRFADGPVHTHPVKGTHFSMLDKAAVKEIARKLRPSLARPAGSTRRAAAEANA